MTVEIDEGQRQAILLALAHLAIARPGWDYMLGECADELRPGPVHGFQTRVPGPPIVLPDTVKSGRELYDRFKELRRQEAEHDRMVDAANAEREARRKLNEQ